MQLKQCVTIGALKWKGKPIQLIRENKVYQNEVNNSQHTKWVLHATYQEPLGARAGSQTQAGCRYVNSHREIPNATMTPQLLSPRSWAPPPLLQNPSKNLLSEEGKKKGGEKKGQGKKKWLIMGFELIYTRCTSNLCTPLSLSGDICKNTILSVLGSGRIAVPKTLRS